MGFMRLQNRTKLYAYAQIHKTKQTNNEIKKAVGLMSCSKPH